MVGIALQKQEYSGTSSLDYGRLSFMCSPSCPSGIAASTTWSKHQLPYSFVHLHILSQRALTDRCSSADIVLVVKK